MKPIFDRTIHDVLDERLMKLENSFDADVIFFYGQIDLYIVKPFRDLIEGLKKDKKNNRTLCIVLNTPGGSAVAVELLVKITRHHYNEVYFIVPDFAFSAGTIFCMSGDKIYMDYSSSLGPIDPQVNNGKRWVPAMGYLDKVESLIEKSKAGKLTQAELIMLRDVDLAMLRDFEQNRDLTIAFLKQWLVEYKFKDWKTHATTPSKMGKIVTPQEKAKRAEQIATILGNNKRWLSHGRSIGIDVLTKELKLRIEDLSDDSDLQNLVRDYNDLIVEYIAKNGIPFFLHSRNYV